MPHTFRYSTNIYYKHTMEFKNMGKDDNVEESKQTKEHET
jgi:hypothetical protein